MYKGKKIVVVMPFYHSACTLKQTYDEFMAHGIVDLTVIFGDASCDETVELARMLPHTLLHIHPANRGYGANQKSCFRLALEEGADIIIMVHPDYQYAPQLIPVMAAMIATDFYPCVLGSRILGGDALRGGMPYSRYFFNRLLTFVENLMTGAKLSEYHTGYRAFSRKLLEQLPLEKLSDNIVFDNQMLVQILWLGATIAEITCPIQYHSDASSINLPGCLVYGWGCLKTGIDYRLAKMRLKQSALFPRDLEASWKNEGQLRSPPPSRAESPR
jgi:glycosyltransferase involved in cell wall biosynthesis